MPTSTSLAVPRGLASAIDAALRQPQAARMSDTLAPLEADHRRDRRTADPATSYVATLTAKGRAKIAQKLGEEAVETVIAAIAATDKAADRRGRRPALPPARAARRRGTCRSTTCRAELDRREGVSGIDEKAAAEEPTDADRRHPAL